MSASHISTAVEVSVEFQIILVLVRAEIIRDVIWLSTDNELAGPMPVAKSAKCIVQVLYILWKYVIRSAYFWSAMSLPLFVFCLTNLEFCVVPHLGEYRMRLDDSISRK